MSITIGIDPGNSYTGMCQLFWLDDGQIHTVVLHRIVGLGPMERTFAERIVPALVSNSLALAAAERVAVGVERPPPTARKDVNHGHQAPIGEAAGFTAGLVVGECMRRGWSHHRLSVQSWRQPMLIWAARKGFVRQAPSRRRQRAIPGTHSRSRVQLLERVPSEDGEGWDIIWKDCDHKTRATTYEAMTAAVERGCAACAKPQVPATADEVRDAWKRLACEIVEHFFPDAYRALVHEAAAAAKSVKPDWQYAGVADACEAFGIALQVRELELTHA